MKWVSLLAILLVACGDDSNKSAPMAERDAGPDLDVPDLGADMAIEEDQAADMPVGPQDCVVTNTETSLVLDEASRSGQFYSTAAFDGAGVWVVYTAPTSEESSNEGIHAIRVGCDGVITSGPLVLSDSNEARNYMPVVDSHGGRTAVVWVHQPNDGNAKSTKLQFLTQAGGAVLESPVDITPQVSGEFISETAWSPSIALGEDFLWHASEVLGPETQVVVQRVNFDGSVESVFFVSEEKDVNQLYPSIGLTENGAVVSWTREGAEGAEKTYFSRIPEGASMGGAAQPALAIGDSNPLSHLAPRANPQGANFLAFQSTTNNSSQILVRNVSEEATGVYATFGATNFINFRPTVRGFDGGGVVAWYRYTTSPTRNSLALQSFEWNDGEFVNGPEVVVFSEFVAIPPYGPGLTVISEDTVFVSWSQGDSGANARVYGKFVRLGQ